MIEVKTGNEQQIIENEISNFYCTLEFEYKNICKIHNAYLLKRGGRRYLELNNFTLFCVLSQKPTNKNSCHLDISLYHLTFDSNGKPLTTLRIPVPLLNLDEHRLTFVRYELSLNDKGPLWTELNGHVAGCTTQQLIDIWIDNLLNNAV